MRTNLKSILLNLPLPIRKLSVLLRDFYWYLHSFLWESSVYKELLKNKFGQKSISNRILVYGLHGLQHGGTEKNLQLIANSLADTYKVFYMYGEENDDNSRINSMSKKITFVPFSFSCNEVSIPHKLNGMTPHIKEVIYDNQIDLLITASPGYSHYPWNIITHIPIVLLNIFGAPTLQKNITSVIYNSNTTKRHAENWIGDDPRAHVRYAPLYNLPPSNICELGTNLRNTLCIQEGDFVFGRIGRADDTIFDPIGIRAWQKIASKYPQAHFVIMSPSPTLVKIVESENIPRVHFLPPSSQEEDVWAFHGAIDAMAHFRYDGETSGVAIAESLYAGNPVISHKSHIWNAHLEYLTEEFSRVAKKDDVDSYAVFMEEFISLHKDDTGTWRSMQEHAQKTAKNLFSPETYADFTKQLVSAILNKN